MTEFSKIINLGKSRFRVIDLTEPLREDVEVYPGEPKPSKKVVSDIRERGFQYNVFSLGEHSFHPHGDAPNHQNPELQHLGFEIFGLECAFNRTTLLDLSAASVSKEVDGIRYLTRIEVAHLKPYEKIISNKSALVIRTGYDLWLESNRPHKPGGLPHLSPEAAKYVDSFEKLRVFGIDSLTIDPVDVRLAHRTLKRFMIVESLVHLHEIPEKARSCFDLQTTAVRIVGATGGPVVAYAYIEE